MSNIVAAIGMGQLEVLDERVKRKREIFNEYRHHLAEVPGIDFMPEAVYGQSNRWLTVILVTPEAFGADRETIRLALEKENIESRPVWKPMHLQPVFEIQAESSMLEARSKKTDRLKSSNADNPSWTKAEINQPIQSRVVGGAVAEDFFERGLCLPSGTAMTARDLERIVGMINGCRDADRRLPAFSSSERTSITNG
jgi:dTDP-4-amino-4,6-dideoxygalactose transaminase